MKRNVKGSMALSPVGMSLLEVMIYLNCSVLLMSLAGYAAVRIHESVRQRTALTEKWVQLAMAFHLLREDLKRAPSNARKWKLKEKVAAVIALDAGDCGWAIERGRLLRSTGMYSKIYQIWAKRAVSVVLDQAEALLFEYCYREGRLIGVRVSLSAKTAGGIVSFDGFVATVAGEDG